MPRKSIERSRALGPELRRRREELGLTLREVAESTEQSGRPIPISTLAKIEQGQVDPGVLRLHQLLKVYQLPMQVAQDVLDLEEIAAELPAESDPDALYAEACRLWQDGDLDHGLAHFIALRERSAEDSIQRQKGVLAFAGACAALGKFRMSLQLIEALLLQAMRNELRAQAYVQAAIAWDGLGAPDVALAFLDRAEHHLDAADQKPAAWLHHKKAGVLCAQGDLDGARASVDEADRVYRAQNDRFGRARLSGLQVRVLREGGDLDGALQAAVSGRRLAKKNGYEIVENLRALDEGRVRVLMGDVNSGLEILRRALAVALDRNDRGAQFYAHFFLAEGYDKAGDPERARIERDAARYFVQFVDEDGPETRAMRGGA